jgi:hypothetical protein
MNIKPEFLNIGADSKRGKLSEGYSRILMGLRGKVAFEGVMVR